MEKKKRNIQLTSHTIRSYIDFPYSAMKPASRPRPPINHPAISPAGAAAEVFEVVGLAAEPVELPDGEPELVPEVEPLALVRWLEETVIPLLFVQWELKSEAERGVEVKVTSAH